MNGFTVQICQHCGRPISGIPTTIGGFMYHFECTRSPYANNQYLPNMPMVIDSKVKR